MLRGGSRLLKFAYSNSEWHGPRTRDPKTVSLDLYSGTPGVVLFFLELYRSTNDQTYLKDARAAADYLLAHLADEKETGLYDRISGIGFTLTETFKATRDLKYREGALRCLQLLYERAEKAGRGIEWSGTTDIISGSAGIGLFLLYAARELKNPHAREVTQLAGLRLIEFGPSDRERAEMGCKF